MSQTHSRFATATVRSMTRGGIIGAVLLSMLTACGGSGEAEREPDEIAALTVRVTAEQVVGCIEATTRSGLDVGNGSQLVVSDGSGAVLVTGTLDLTRGAEICDWTAVVDVPVDAEFYVIDAGGELATVSAEDMANDWSVDIHIGITGTVTVS